MENYFELAKAITQKLCAGCNKPEVNRGEFLCEQCRLEYDVGVVEWEYQKLMGEIEHGREEKAQGS